MPHSPTPWRAELAAEQILAANGRIVVYEMNTNEDDARMICVAVNSFEAMRAALRAVNQFIENGIELGYIRMPDSGGCDTASTTPGIVRAALALAEQEP